MFMQQTDWLTSKHGDIEIDFITRFENFKNDFIVTAEELGVKAKRPPLKCSSHSYYTDYYTCETVDIIQKHFAMI